jgi:hypothetical protein
MVDLNHVGCSERVLIYLKFSIFFTFAYVLLGSSNFFVSVEPSAKVIPIMIKHEMARCTPLSVIPLTAEVVTPARYVATISLHIVALAHKVFAFLA